MEIMGIDLGTRAVHVVQLSDFDVVSSTSITIEDNMNDRHHVVLRLHSELMWMIQEDQPDAIFIEEPLVAGVRNLRTSLHIAQVCGGVLSAAAGMERVYLIPVSTWKKATIGNGGATKQEVAAWLPAHHPEIAEVCGGQQDLIDAACIALYGQGCIARSNDISRDFVGREVPPELA